jgi:hypothetical protein
MSRLRSNTAALALVLASAGCGRTAERPAATPPSISPSPSTSTATSTGTATLLRTAVANEPAARLTLTPGTEVVVDPRATFELELAARVPDARLVLLDAKEDFVPASSTREIGASTRLTLAPAVPLVPGSRYALRLDGASERDLHDDAGRAFAPISLPLLAAGTPPPPEAQTTAKRKKRHR